MIRIVAFLFLLLTDFVHAQVSGVVVDAETKLPIPFVNVWEEFGDFGTTTTELGTFELPTVKNGENVILSAVGYETEKLEIKHNDTVFLAIKPLELSEVKVGKGKGCELKLGKLKGRKVSFLQYSKDGKNGSPMIMARYFPNTCNKPIFLKKVKIKPSASENATFNLRFYSVDEDGSPKDFLYDKNIIISVGSLALNKTINLEKLRIPVPGDGIFVAIEWLIIDENKRSPKSKYNSTSFTFWEPGITAFENPDNTESWSNSGGHWSRQRNYSLAMEVEFGD
ncbi:carboxypeptidase-like regulatory domain-containing protein [Flavobacterium sp. MAH-1]|uniref:Carboxypeptidase-like regulatory domain-containing protein n=1 Tax=Flavobacterium agri TaxID=2743471 RepID=A0A7Y8Y136_9FLAO|nr:carboxypeptidase-like regulatory domain-containing protein [Flavobacterium agri]NUY80637.1 carboxypeptidase-like regulatory domain-containing protein [Flavobacterium agri]NYA70661.1 carboxypeptidase-like regulatory domain-containing protein [Flavobacterium agri]